jgi:hypothetical protein
MKITSLFIVLVVCCHTFYASSFKRKVTFNKVVDFNECNELSMTSEVNSVVSSDDYGAVSTTLEVSSIASDDKLDDTSNSDLSNQSKELARRKDLIRKQAKFEDSLAAACRKSNNQFGLESRPSHNSQYKAPDASCFKNLFACCSRVKIYASQAKS